MPKLIRLGAMFAPILLLIAGCGGDRSGGPRGDPDLVVGNAPQHTISSRTAKVIVDGIDLQAIGVVDLTTGASRLDVSDGSTVVFAGNDIWRKGRGEPRFRPVAAADLPPSLRPADPAAAVNLLGGMSGVRSDGGAEVRGSSTITYTVTIDPVEAASGLTPEQTAGVRRLTATAGTGQLHVQVAIDSLGRVRRLLLPVPLRGGPPTTRVDGEPVAVTIDYVTFGGPATVTVPPGS